MAKQTGTAVFIGTINGLCFYRMNGQYYARTSNPLSRKRVLTDAAFAGTRRYAQWLAEASPIASAVYRCLPAEKRQKGLYRALTGKALLLLKAGLKGEEVSTLLTNEMERQVATTEQAAALPVRKKQVYNKSTGIPLPGWPGLRTPVVIKKADIFGKTLHADETTVNTCRKKTRFNNITRLRRYHSRILLVE